MFLAFVRPAQVSPSSLPAFTLAYGTLLKASFAPFLRKRDKKKERARADDQIKEKKRLEGVLSKGVGEEGKRGAGRSRESESFSLFLFACSLVNWGGLGRLGESWRDRRYQGERREAKEMVTDPHPLPFPLVRLATGRQKRIKSVQAAQIKLDAIVSKEEAKKKASTVTPAA